MTITIDSSNNTLSGTRDAVNASSAGVTASLNTVDGTQTRYYLQPMIRVLTTALSISTDDDDGNDANTSGLSRLAPQHGFRLFLSNLSEARSSQDASFL